MTRCHLLPLTALLSAGLLAGCGGGLGTDRYDDGPETIRPMQNLSSQHITESVGFVPDEQQEVRSLVTVGTRGPVQYGGWVGRRTGFLTFLRGALGEEDRQRDYASPGVELVSDDDGSGAPSRLDGTSFLELNDGAYEDGTISESEVVIGEGGRFLVTERHGNRLYMPAEGAEGRMGAWSTLAGDGRGAAFAVFGREMTRAQRAELTGFATFSGLSEAEVYGNYLAVGLDEDLIFVRDGTYEGTSNGRVDFNTGDVRLEADLKNRRGVRMGVVTEGTLSANGAIRGDTVFSGLREDGELVSGDFEGHLFGSDGRDLGGTFAGGVGNLDNGNAEVPEVAVGGTMLMSR